MPERQKPEPKTITESTPLEEVYDDLSLSRFYVVGREETIRYVDTGLIKARTWKYWIKDRENNKILPVPSGYGWWQNEGSARDAALELNRKYAKGEL